MSQQTDWKAAYETSGQYQADKEKAQNFGHSDLSFATTFARAISQEEFNERLARFQQPRTRKELSGWQLEVRSSEEFGRLGEEAISNGWTKAAFASTLLTSDSAEDWKQKVEKFLQQRDSN